MYIPDRVRKALRKEVGFGCPVDDCGSPYLTYHHFDPPRRVREHNEVSGMIALCREHHDHAEGGAFTDDQLRTLKLEGAERNRRIEGRFLWRRQQLLVHVGQTLTFESGIPLAFNGIPVVSLARDVNHDLLVSINMLTTSMMPRLRMFENDWVSIGNPTDLESPPFGRKLSASYPNGDRIDIEFKEIQDADRLGETLPLMTGARQWAIDLMSGDGVDVPLKFPATLLDVALELPDVGISVTSEGLKTAMGEMQGLYGAYAPCAVNLGHERAPYPTAVNTFAISPDRAWLRLASMNDSTLWNVSDRIFRKSAFLLDGCDFEQCRFEECWLAVRGNRFRWQDNQNQDSTIVAMSEIQSAFNVIKLMTERGIRSFVEASERLGQAGAESRRRYGP
jgi:hypothetical protein